MFRSIIVLSSLLIYLCLGVGCKNSSMPVHAAIVYKTGGAQPVARTKFYLLKKNFEEIQKETGFPPYLSSRAVNAGKLIDRNLGREDSMREPGIIELTIKDSIISTVVTDFDGKAVFENIPSGIFYIAGFSETRKPGESLIWCVKVDTSTLDGKPIILDQQNATLEEPFF